MRILANLGVVFLEVFKLNFTNGKWGEVVE